MNHGRIALAALLLASPLAAQERPDTAAMAARIMELAQPGPEHERLAALAGTWDVTYRAGSTTITARAENRMILGGRFLMSEVTDTGEGMPFGSLHIMGFDRGPGVYTAVGFDTFGTFYVTGAGPWNDARQGAVLSGSYQDRTTGHAHDYEFIWTLHGADRFTWDIVFLDGGKRQTVMEGDYRRRKSD